MTTKDTGGPAFPHRFENENGVPFFEPGMTLRDAFAMKAPITLDQAIAVEYQAGLPYMNESERAQVYATWAALRYGYADAMLSERAK